jgi:hypothetical protein
MAEMDTRTVPIGDITPYENNPRRIPQTAIDAVAKSIELFGWNQPIVVDPDMVIVVGHTRRLAAMKLGLTEVPILVTGHLTPDQIKEYRLVDNRTGELSTWDYDSLVMELREFEKDMVTSFFPEINLEMSLVSQTVASQRDIELADKKIGTVQDAAEESLQLTEVTCPSCMYIFKVRTRSLPGMTDVKAFETAKSNAPARK